MDSYIYCCLWILFFLLFPFLGALVYFRFFRHTWLKSGAHTYFFGRFYTSLLCKYLVLNSYILSFFAYSYTLVVSLGFDVTFYPYQVVTVFGLGFYDLVLGVDNLSILFLILLFLLVFLCTLLYVGSHGSGLQLYLGEGALYSGPIKLWGVYLRKHILFLFLLFILTLVLFLFFLVLDFLPFYVFFESSMVPLYFLIGVFGSRVNRVKASYYIFFYTFIGGIFFLIGIFILYSNLGTLDINLIHSSVCGSALSTIHERMVWVCFFVPFAIKVPMIPFHVWLPEAHVEASTEGSILLAGLLLKLGAFGILRFLLPLFPQSSIFFSPLVIVLCLVGVVYTSFVAFFIVDVKKLIAYSSIAHMNFTLLGLFSFTYQGLQGGIYLMFTHGIISSGLFISIGFLYARYHTRLVYYYQGLLYTYPVWSAFFFIFVLGNFGFPGTGGFIGEFLIILGLFQKNLVVGLVSMIGPLTCAIYSITLYTKLTFGIPQLRFYPPLYQSVLFSMTSSEFVVFLLLTCFVFISGIVPDIFLDMAMSTTHYLYVLLNYI